MKVIFKLLLISFLFSSCTFIAGTVISTKMRDPKVETTASTMQFQLDKKFDTSLSFIINADTSNAYDWMTKTIAGDYEIFNSKGLLLEYNGSKSCGGDIFNDFIIGKIDSFKIDSGNYNLKNILSICYNYNDQRGDFKTLPKADYFVIGYWSKFAGRKTGYKNGITFYEEMIKSNLKENRKILLIKLNADMQEKWGMKPNAKTRLKVKAKNREVSMTFGQLPWTDEKLGKKKN